MSDTKIAAQLYTLRDFTKTPEDVATTLPKVKALGYDAVQLSALGPIEPERLKELLDESELVVAATHIPFDRLRNDADSVIREHKLWGCDYLALGSMPEEYRNGEGFARFGREITDIARPYVEAGLNFSYHNHSFELERFDGRTGLDILFAESDPAIVHAEIDTYWIQNGGGDPAAWIRGLAGRVPLLHLKDMAVYDNVPTFAEVGEGNLNWPAILAAGEEAGSRWFIVEQDKCRRDPFESLKISLDNLHKLGLT